MPPVHSAHVRLRRDLVPELAGLYRLQMSLAGLDEEKVAPEERDYWLAWSVSREILGYEEERLHQVVEEMEATSTANFTRVGTLWPPEDVVTETFMHETIPMPVWDGCVRLAAIHQVPPEEMYSRVANRVLDAYLAQERGKMVNWALRAPSPRGDEARASAISILLRGAVSTPIRDETESLMLRIAAALRKAEAGDHRGIIFELLCEILLPDEG